MSRVFASSMAFASNETLGSLLVPLRGLTCRRCRIPFMVRTTGLRSFHRRILRFTTPSRPGAAAACYVALWRLPRPDFHRLVIRTFQGTPSAVGRLVVFLTSRSGRGPKSHCCLCWDHCLDSSRAAMRSLATRNTCFTSSNRVSGRLLKSMSRCGKLNRRSARITISVCRSRVAS